MLNRIRNFSNSPRFLLIPFIITSVALLGDKELAMPCMICHAMIIAFLLFFNDDLFPVLFSFLSIVLVGTTMIGSLESVIPYIPFGIPAAIGFVFHLIYYHRPFHRGPSLPGLFATSAAILLGGSGVIATQQSVFNGAAAYHLIGLSLGLLFFYHLFSCNRKSKRSYDPIRYFLLVMLLLGLLCATQTLSNFLHWMIPAVREGKELVISEYLSSFLYKNTYANILIMCIPAAFYFAGISGASRIQQIGAFLLGGFMYFTMLLTCARTGLLFGSVLFGLCLVYYLFSRTPRKIKILCLALLVVCAATALLVFHDAIYHMFIKRLENGIVVKEESRFALLKRSLGDFFSYPLFGIGIDNSVNVDIYNFGEKEGCIGWYHMYFPQIWGSMGLCGMIAFAYQLVLRLKIILFKPDYQTVALSLSYLGLFLYSQTDPGEFIPIPFAFLAVLIFVLLEGRNEKFTPVSIEKS